MVKTWIVYKHVSPSNKVYVGITSQSNIKRRWFRGSGYNRCPIFMKAILKYGWDNIKHQVLFTNLTEARAKNLEKDLIRHYKNLGVSYNITDGGDGTLGKSCPEELRRRLSEERRGVIPWKAIKEAAKVNKGKKKGPRDRRIIEKVRATRLLNGKKCTKEQIQANIERNLVRSNPVLQFDLQGNFIKEYRSVKFAAESMGGSRGSLLNCLNPLRTESKTFKGYIWKYKNQ